MMTTKKTIRQQCLLQTLGSKFRPQQAVRRLTAVRA
jgi:hypothetical protein